MSVRTRATVSALTAALIASGGVVLAGSASAADYPRTPVLSEVLDAVAPTPDGMDSGYFSEKERIDGILGLNDFPGRPLGSFPQPANPRDPKRMPGAPGSGVQGMAADLTGINPRPPGTDVGQDGPSRTQLGPLALPICDSPDPCPIDPLTADVPTFLDDNDELNELLMPVGDVLALVDPDSVDGEDEENEALSAPAGQEQPTEVSVAPPAKKKRPSKR